MAGLGAVKTDAPTHRRTDARMHRSPVVPRCGVTVILAAALTTALSAARLRAQELTTVRFAVQSWAAVDSVRSLGIDIVEIHPRDGGTVDLVAVVGPRDRDALASRGFLVDEVPRPPLVAAQEARRRLLGPRAYAVFRDFDDPVRGVAAFLRSLAASRPNVFVDSVGASFEGRPILVAKVGAPDDSPSRPNVLFMATYHAREWVATEMALRLLLFLADSLGSRPGGTALLASRDVWVLPVVNPDGYEFTFAGQRLWRKNRRPNADGTVGVDLNRNHAAQFAFDDLGSSRIPGSETYRGTWAESEPETRAVAAFHRAHPPAVGVSYHTYAGAVLYPWGHAAGAFTGDQAVYRALAGTSVAPAVWDSLPGSSHAYYHPGPGWQLYTTNGDYDNWAYEVFGTLTFTPELTAGCCIAGQSYGFEFPDDDLLVERVFRDNLPFALGVLQAASDVANAVGPSGLAVPAATLEAVWPRVRAAGPAAAGNVGIEIATDPGVVRAVFVSRDSLGEGRSFARVSSADPAVADARAVRIARFGLVAELVARDGAEREGSPWRGFVLDTSTIEGARCWYGFRDTLTSPEIDVTSRSELTLFFWTRHLGSVFDQSRRGRVEISTDDGVTWRLVGQLVGNAPEWYPVAVSLEAAAGSSSLKIRFIADGLDWYLDAVAVTAGQSTLFGPAARAVAEQVRLSANPVRAGTVTVRWTPGGGSARVEVYSFAGTLLAAEMQPADLGRWTWNLETAAGARIVNGVYIVVVTRADGLRLRRRLFVARSGG